MLSVSVIVKNEEKNLARMLDSVTWADEIVIVDTGSEDRTIEIAKSYGCRVYESEWLGFGKCKQLAVDYCKNQWVLSLDADEIVTPELRQKINEILQQEKKLAGYRIKRKSFYLNKLINHCGWNRDYTLRLFDKRRGRFNQKMLHEYVEVEGEIGLIKELLLHYTYPTINSHIARMVHYTDISSLEMFKQGKRSSLFSSFLRSIWKFIDMYFIKLGFLDGKSGFVLCFNSGMGVFWKYAKLWELNKR